MGTPVVTTRFGAMADYTYLGESVPYVQKTFLHQVEICMVGDMYSMCRRHSCIRWRPHICSLRMPGSMLAASAARLLCLRILALHRGACGNNTRRRLSATRRRSSATRTTGGSTRSAISRRPRPPYLMSSTHNPTWPHPPAFCARRERSGALRFVVRRCALVGEISSEPYPCPCATLPAWLCPSNEVD